MGKSYKEQPRSGGTVIQIAVIQVMLKRLEPA